MLGTHKISIAIAVLRTSSALFSHKQLVASAKQGRNKRRAEEGSNKDILLYVTVTVTVHPTDGSRSTRIFCSAYCVRRICATFG